MASIPASLRASITGFLLTSSVFIGASSLIWIFYTIIITNRGRATLSRRKIQALEMKVLKARLDRLHAKIDRGEVMGEEEMQDVKRMERLFWHWVRSLEIHAAADEEGSSAAVTNERWPGWF